MLVVTYARGQQTMAYRPNGAHFLFLSVKVYWTTAIPIHLHVIYDGFCGIAIELSTYNKRPCGSQSLKYLLRTLK